MRPVADEPIRREDVAYNAGVWFLRCQETVPMRSVFTGMAYLRKLAGHRRRVQREMKLQRESIVNSREAPFPRAAMMPPKENWKVFAGVTWGELVMVDCADCGKTLLSERHEPIRAGAVRYKMKRVLQRLPPPIAMKRDGKSYCETCTGGEGNDSLAAKILDCLQASEIAVRTSDLIAMFAVEMANPRQRIRIDLERLERKGFIRRCGVRDGEQYWARVGENPNVRG